jgi:hypothetical protein
VQKISAMNACENCNKWLKKGTPFNIVNKSSLHRCNTQPEIARLRAVQATYSCAAGYIEEIIRMDKTKETNTDAIDEGPEAIELEAMGTTPSMETSKL